MSPKDLLTLAQTFDRTVNQNKVELLSRVKRAQRVAFLASEKVRKLYAEYIEAVGAKKS
jgi:hypothetical protein